VVIYQHSRKLLKMDILMSETCWAHNKWNKIARDIKLVFHSSTIAMMHGPINIRLLPRHVYPSARNNSAPDGRIFMKLDTWLSFESSVEKIQVSLKSDDRYFTRIPKRILIISRSILLRMRNVSDKSCRENRNTILCSITSFRK